MKYLIDSSAWIDYLEGSKVGQTVNTILQEDNEIFVVSINIAEVISKIKRNGGDIMPAYNSIISRSQIIDVTPKIAKEAGLLHAEIKKKIKSFSLADAIIITSARQISAKVITKDSHFKNFKEVLFLG